MALIHVIIPVYNARQFLRETVNSVLMQPYKGIDVVLVNDGSTDGSDVLCDEIAAQESRVTVLHKANGGVSSARNTGIAHLLKDEALTGYIAFLDADDLWFAHAVTTEFSNHLINEEADIFALCGINCNSNLHKFSQPALYQDHSAPGGNHSIWSLRGHFCANLFSVALLRRWNIRFMEGLKYSEDKIFLMQCVFFAEQVQFSSRLLHIYRENKSSAMKQIFSISPIDYYIPIINGWIASDEFVNSWEPTSRKHIEAGHVLAGIYFMDMAAEHFGRWGTRKELFKVFQAHPHYDLFVNLKPNQINAKQYKNHNLLLNHPRLFQLKYNLIGIVHFAARVILRTKPGFAFRQWMKYPLTEIPSNK